MPFLTWTISPREKRLTMRLWRRKISVTVTFIENQSNKGHVNWKLSREGGEKSGPGSCSCTYVAFVACALNAHPCASVCAWLDKIVGHTNVRRLCACAVHTSSIHRVIIVENCDSKRGFHGGTLILTGCKVHFAVVVHSIWHCSYLP